MNRAEKIKINIKNGAQSIEMYEFNRTRKCFHLKRKFYLFESLHIRDVSFSFFFFFASVKQDFCFLLFIFFKLEKTDFCKTFYFFVI